MRIGIDVGGTKIEGIALDGSGGELRRVRITAPRDDYRQTLTAVASVVAGLEEATGARGSIGVGIPGVVSPVTGLVKNAKSTWLNGHPLEQDLQVSAGHCLSRAGQLLDAGDEIDIDRTDDDDGLAGDNR